MTEEFCRNLDTAWESAGTANKRLGQSVNEKPTLVDRIEELEWAIGNEERQLRATAGPKKYEHFADFALKELAQSLADICSAVRTTTDPGKEGAAKTRHHYRSGEFSPSGTFKFWCDNPKCKNYDSSEIRNLAEDEPHPLPKCEICQSIGTWKRALLN